MPKLDISKAYKELSCIKALAEQQYAILEQ